MFLHNMQLQKKLISTETSAENFRCLHGIRFLSMTWVIFGHSYLFSLNTITTMLRAQEIVSQPFAQTIINSSMVIDTFLFVSGLLVCYITVKHLRNKQRLNLFQFVFHRLWRMLPTYVFILSFAMLVPLMGSGPRFNDVMNYMTRTCHEDWWKNLLFINNFDRYRDLCLPQTWYISCDFQLYLASLFVILPLAKSEKVGLTINVMFILASITYTAVIMRVMNTGFTILITDLDTDYKDEGFFYVYGNPITRAGPYFIGTLVGYILLTRPTIKFSKKFQLASWTLAVVATTGVLYSTAFWYNVHAPSKVETAFYGCMYHVAFTAGVAWMTLCCMTGQGGFINLILSWKAWIPLSKLTFLMYLIQPIFQIAYNSVLRSPQELTHIHMIVQGFGNICISALLALVANLLVESPFTAMEKLLFPRKSKIPEKCNEEKNGELSDLPKFGEAYNKAFDSKL